MMQGSLRAVTLPLMLFCAAPLHAQEIADGGFESGTALHPFVRSCGVDPWLPGQWNSESAQLVVGSAVGISPRTGAGMLRIDSSCVVSQVTQIIALPSPPPSEVTYFAYVNAQATAPVSLTVGAGDGQTCVGTLTNETSQSANVVLDGLPATWQLLQVTRVVPPSSAFLRVEILVPCNQHPAGGVFVDDVSAEIPLTGVTGFADLHVHQFTNESMAGAWLYGEATGPLATAVPRCNGNLDFLFGGRNHGELDLSLVSALFGPVGWIAAQAFMGNDLGLHAGRRHGVCVAGDIIPGFGMCVGNVACNLLEQPKCNSSVCEWRSIGTACRDKPNDGKSVDAACLVTSNANCENSCYWEWPLCLGNAACNLASFSSKSKCGTVPVCEWRSTGNACRDKDGDDKSVGLKCNTLGQAACEATCTWDPNWGAVTLHAEKRAHDFTDGNTAPPDKASWPAWDVLAHQQVHVDWLYQAYQGGLRLMVMSALNNEAFCGLLPKENRTPGYTCDDSENVTRQLNAAKDLAADPNVPWYEIAYTPAEALSIIQQNKLAVILSVEASDIFNTSDPQASLQDLYNEGARTLQPLHQFNSKLGGVATHDNMIKLIQTIKNLPSLNHLCKSNGGTGSYAKCDATLNNLNYLGLTNEGRRFVVKMLNMGMPIDIAHMSERSVKDVERIVSAACNYPVYVSHAHVRELLDVDSWKANKRNEKTLPDWVIGLVRSTGGMIGLRTGADHYESNSYQGALAAAGVSPSLPPKGPVALKGKSSDRGGNEFHFGYAVDYLVRVGGVHVGLGSDFNGLIPMMVFDGEEHDRKMAGLAHIGKLPDMFTKLQQTGIDSASYTELRTRSAERYLQMWNRAANFAAGQSCCPQPVVSGVIPPEAWAGRANRVMIVGAGFTPHESLAVTLQNASLAVSCSDVEFISSTKLVCTLPILPPDTTYDVTVMNGACNLQATKASAYFASPLDTGEVPPPVPPDSDFTQADLFTVMADPIDSNGFFTPNASKIAAVDWEHPAWLGLSTRTLYAAADRPMEDGYPQPDWDAVEFSPERVPLSAMMAALLDREDAAFLTDPMTMAAACDLDDAERAQLAVTQGWPPDWPTQLATLCGEEQLEEIPTVSEWGLVVLTLLLLIGAKIHFTRRKTATDVFP